MNINACVCALCSTQKHTPTSGRVAAAAAWVEEQRQGAHKGFALLSLKSRTNERAHKCCSLTCAQPSVDLSAFPLAHRLLFTAAKSDEARREETSVCELTAVAASARLQPTSRPAAAAGKKNLDSSWRNPISALIYCSSSASFQPSDQTPAAAAAANSSRWSHSLSLLLFYCTLKE